MITDITTVSSKGQIVVPSRIREELNLKSGEKLMIIADGSNIMLKKVSEKTLQSFKNLTKDIKIRTKKIGLDKDDVSRAIDFVRDNEGSA